MRTDFACRLSLDRIRDGERVELVAGEGERATIAERLGLVSLDRFDAHAVLSRDGERIEAHGRVQAALRQSCVATGEPVEEHVDEAFDIVFIAEPQVAGGDEEIELSEEECDVVFYEGAAIDLGAAVADTLALAIDPYPRSAEAEASLKDAGVLSEEQAGPFAALAKLKTGAGDNS